MRSSLSQIISAIANMPKDDPNSNRIIIGDTSFASLWPTIKFRLFASQLRVG
jgi:hypothetical protein